MSKKLTTSSQQPTHMVLSTRRAAQISDTHGCGAGAAFDFAEGVYLKGADKRYYDIGRPVFMA